MIANINTYLPMELLREILLYCIESHQMEYGQLASVCRRWRSITTSIASLWSTLRVGTWTERERVAIWLKRAHPKKVVIDTQKDVQGPFASHFLALQDALASTSEWHELTMSSFPSEDIVNQLGFQPAMPMIALRTLDVAAGCVRSPSSTYLLGLVPTEAPLSELKLGSSFASTHFIQPPWFPILKGITVLVVNGRDIHEPFELLPDFTQLHTFEADHLLLPWYELNVSLPLLSTLQKLRLRACSVQWMAGRQFTCLEECTILLPHHWEAVQQHEVQLPSCGKLAYHGYPMTTVRYFHVPQMRAMELRSHDCKEERVYRQLHHLCTVDARISKLTVLHLTLQCSEQVFLRVLKYMGPLQELVLSLAYPSCFWRKFLQLLAAKPSTKDWPEHWGEWRAGREQWKQWCSSQTWHANVLPNLKYLGIQCPTGFSQSECLDNLPLFRLIGWSRAQSTPPLDHLKVWEGRGTANDIVVDYTSTDYMDKHPRLSNETYDLMIVGGMITRRLVIYHLFIPFLQLHSTVIFMEIEDLEIYCNSDHEIPFLPYLEQIKMLVVQSGIIPAYSLNVDLPLIHTLQSLKLYFSTSSWMFGRTFKVLKELEVKMRQDESENLSRHEGLQLDLPACTTLKLSNFSVHHLRFLSCSNVQIFRFEQDSARFPIDEAALKSLIEFLCNCPCLQTLEIMISEDLGWRDSLIQFAFCDALEQGVWRDIRSVEVKIWFINRSNYDEYHLARMGGHHQPDDKWWNEFTVTMEGSTMMMTLKASM